MPAQIEIGPDIVDELNQALDQFKRAAEAEGIAIGREWASNPRTSAKARLAVARLSDQTISGFRITAAIRRVQLGELEPIFCDQSELMPATYFQGFLTGVRGVLEENRKLA